MPVIGFKKLLALTALFALCICSYRTFILFSVPRDAIACDERTDHTPIPSSPEIIDRFRQALSIQTITFGSRDYKAEPLLEIRKFFLKSEYNRY